MVCERCGSMSIRRVRATVFERFLRLFTGKKRFFCKHCGWSGLRVWDENAPRIVLQPSRKSELRLVGVSAHAHHGSADLSAEALAEAER